MSRVCPSSGVPTLRPGPQWAPPVDWDAVRLVFAGSPAAALPSLRALVAAGHDVAAVVTNPDAPTGRGRRLEPSPVGRLADELGIRTLKPARARDPEFVAALTQVAPDACPVVAWGKLIPDSLLDVPVHGWINLHFSLLPAWRGAAPVQRALMAGDAQGGVTTFRIVHDLDAGPVFRQVATPIGPDETAGDLLDRLASLGAATLAATLDDIAAGVVPTPQPEGALTVAPKVGVDDVRIDWAAPARTVHNLVRGACPDPGAWTTLDGARFKVLATTLDADGVPALAPGQLHADRHALWAGAADGALRLVRVQASGKPPMAGADWARGAHLNPGDHFA